MIFMLSELKLASS